MSTHRRFALVNGRVIQPQEIFLDKALIIEEGRISALIGLGNLSEDLPRIDVEGRYITPGLIDIHIHGANGHSFIEATPQAFKMILAECARHGVTSVLATLATGPISDLVNCLEFSYLWRQDQRFISSMLGVHLEGPYINMEQRGAHNPAHIRVPNDGTLDYLLEHHHIIKMMTYAPELPGGLELTSKLNKLGIIPAAGHSSARAQDVVKAIKLGLRHVIHLWSGQSSTVRQGPWRIPGLLEASLTLEGLTAEVIADNKHLPPLLLKLALKCIGPDHLCAVSDATSGAGLPNGSRFTLGDVVCEVREGVGMLLDRTSFAGSTTLLNEMIPILVEFVGVSIVDALRMTTLTPAKIIGVADHKGSLAQGKDADIAIFNEDFTVWGTLVRGSWSYVTPALSQMLVDSRVVQQDELETK